MELIKYTTYTMITTFPIPMHAKQTLNSNICGGGQQDETELGKKYSRLFQSNLSKQSSCGTYAI